MYKCVCTVRSYVFIWLYGRVCVSVHFCRAVQIYTNIGNQNPTELYTKVHQPLIIIVIMVNDDCDVSVKYMVLNIFRCGIVATGLSKSNSIIPYTFEPTHIHTTNIILPFTAFSTQMYTVQIALKSLQFIWNFDLIHKRKIQFSYKSVVYVDDDCALNTHTHAHCQQTMHE